MIPQFPEMLTEIDASGIVVDPNNGAEPNGNLCTISLSRVQADSLTPDDIVNFVHLAADHFDASRYVVAPEHQMVFYCWVDDMAGQLRFSVVSSQPLPFGCDVRVVRDLTVIANQLLACQWLDGIPFSELQPVNELEPADDVPTADDTYLLDVFMLDLPRVPSPT